MDSNKLKVLNQIGYRIKRCCGNCEHFKRGGGYNRRGAFGDCTLHKYVHQKHTGGERDLSSYEAGYCDDHQWNNRVVGSMHAFGDLREE